jgi:PTH1 family peptidyl-tRNA hydrolase
VQAPAKTSLRLLVGLGNPGPKYRHTRHNAGWWWVDAVAARHGAVWREEAKFRGEVARARIQGAPGELWLLKPLTFMNLSGESIAALARFHRLEPAEILVAHDELDLPPGTARLKFAGGHGGHNGLRDTITHMGADFWRLRLGIGHPGHKDQVLDYVLNRAAPDDERLIDEAVAASLDALTIFLTEGPEKAMQQLHGRPVNRGH